VAFSADARFRPRVGRPTEPTAQFVWQLLQDGLPIPLDDLIPKRGEGKRSAAPEYEKDALTAK